MSTEVFYGEAHQSRYYAGDCLYSIIDAMAILHARTSSGLMCYVISGNLVISF